MPDGTPDDSLDARIQRAVRELISIEPYDETYPERFAAEKQHLRDCLPAELLGRIEHFGSTAVPGLAAKPIIDMLVEVTNLEQTRQRIAPVLEQQGYDYFWRPTFGDDVPPFYAWFIKRDPDSGLRTHHIHMLESDFQEHWDRLFFRDALRVRPDLAREYERLKTSLAACSPNDRVAYTEGKTEFIRRVTREAKATAGSGY